MSVGLVIVSHSSQLAAGVVELAAQMARDVVLVPAGGTDDGGIGTSLDKVMSALGEADGGDGVVVLTDLGSAVMTAESALEFMGNPGNVVLADAPLVEGAVAAAVAAQSGGALAVVRKAAETALNLHGAAAGATGGAAASMEGGEPGGAVAGVAAAGGREAMGGGPGPGTADGGPGPGTADGGAVGARSAAGSAPGPGAAPDGAVTAVLTLINPLGLHARPAAALAGALGAMDVDIAINGADAQSVFLLMALGAGKGTKLNVTATGPDAQHAVDLVRSEVENGFGEL
ncbi:dihydroxyacetone kinase phosphoryl donor subunit DhaM [Arthrobacter sp. STN4]|uniref:dihydroxyacetone kinase phosphoryl donor subunit DhaM n=1 Tax=Arthrobacter sp. STN4 TaxID=2923276 RepID=UPI002119F195|nr:dihydroxyacetone kinase phosphoryl donor subunit DhaM [Arthrobacter sp. STN4]MCQ9162594.1 PTS-dependent dihydroxyacetone kinase phosphotransferase subunit DhaM [Arthrobacter sp. STN4]